MFNKIFDTFFIWSNTIFQFYKFFHYYLTKFFALCFSCWMIFISNFFFDNFTKQKVQKFTKTLAGGFSRAGPSLLLCSPLGRENKKPGARGCRTFTPRQELRWNDPSIIKNNYPAVHGGLRRIKGIGKIMIVPSLPTSKLCTYPTN